MLSSDHVRLRAEAMGHPSLTDPITGLANRLHFELVYNYIFEAGDRGLAFTVMLVTCQADGEDVVKAVAEAVQRTTRTSDLVAHVGGGRFVVLLLGTNLQGARIAADRVEVSLESVATGAVSFGLASYAPDLETSTLLLDAAERALETAQAAGGGVEFG